MNDVFAMLNRRRVPILGLAAVLALILIPLNAFAQDSTTAPEVSGDGVIVGTTTNGTTGEPGGMLPVSLEIFDASGFIEERGTVTDAEGNFSFEGLSTSPDIAYNLTVAYQGVSYGSESIDFEAGSDEINATIQIFEPSTDTSGVSITRRGLILTGVDPSSGNLMYLDVLSLQNDADHAVVSNKLGHSLEFAVPPNASQVTPFPGGTYNMGNATIEGATLFSSTPLVPGSSTATLGYTVPYTGNSVTIEVQAAYPMQELRILIPISTDEANKNIEIASSGLEQREDETIGPQTYHVWAADNVAPGNTIRVGYRELPDSQVAPNTLKKMEPLLIAAGAGILMLLVVGLIAWKRDLFAPRPVQVNPQLTASLDVRRDELIAQLRALEHAHEIGEVSEDDYADYRQTILEQLRLISRQSQDLDQQPT